MKTTRHLLFLPLVVCLITNSQAQTPLVGPGSNYADVFSPSASVTYDVPGGELLSITLSDGFATANSGIWDLTAQGGPTPPSC
ncbi:MAG: hypothetical protein HS117_25180 [Verrucomicrobiaceae bacterium]|nr:hypothetical protein [Verrucomicrobiaceae bacterium]